MPKAIKSYMNILAHCWFLILSSDLKTDKKKYTRKNTFSSWFSKMVFENISLNWQVTSIIFTIDQQLNYLEWVDETGQQSPSFRQATRRRAVAWAWLNLYLGICRSNASFIRKIPSQLSMLEHIENIFQKETISSNISKVMNFLGSTKCILIIIIYYYPPFKYPINIYIYIYIR